MDLDVSVAVQAGHLGGRSALGIGWQVEQAMPAALATEGWT